MALLSQVPRHHQQLSFDLLSSVYTLEYCFIYLACNWHMCHHSLSFFLLLLFLSLLLLLSISFLCRNIIFIQYSLGNHTRTGSIYVCCCCFFITVVYSTLIAFFIFCFFFFFSLDRFLIRFDSSWCVCFLFSFSPATLFLYINKYNK